MTSKTICNDDNTFMEYIPHFFLEIFMYIFIIWINIARLWLQYVCHELVFSTGATNYFSTRLTVNTGFLGKTSWLECLFYIQHGKWENRYRLERDSRNADALLTFSMEARTKPFFVISGIIFTTLLVVCRVSHNFSFSSWVDFAFVADHAHAQENL